jgi:hypothetical protein
MFEIAVEKRTGCPAPFAKRCRTSSPPSRYTHCTVKIKSNFLIYQEIEDGAVAKSYIKKGFLI